MKTRPVLIGIVNGLLPGLGYLIIKERTTFGVLMLAGTLLCALVMLLDPSPAFDSFLYAVTTFGKAVEAIAYALIALAFAYDAYDLAERKNAVVSTAPTTFPPSVEA